MIKRNFCWFNCTFWLTSPIAQSLSVAEQRRICFRTLSLWVRTKQQDCRIHIHSSECCVSVLTEGKENGRCDENESTVFPLFVCVKQKMHSSLFDNRQSTVLLIHAHSMLRACSCVFCVARIRLLWWIYVCWKHAFLNYIHILLYDWVSWQVLLIKSYSALIE